MPLLFRKAIAFYDKIEKGEINPDGFIDAIRQAFPVVTEFLGRFGIQTDGLREKLSSGAVEASRLLAKEALSIGTKYLRLYPEFMFDAVSNLFLIT